MFSRSKLKSGIQALFDNPSHKDELIFDLFQYQLANNQLFAAFVDSINGNKSPQSLSELSFLPISFFKTHEIKSGVWEAETSFSSSGTTGTKTSKHYIQDLSWYQQISQSIFEHHYGPLNDATVLGLLPSYLERNNSSLVYMVDHFMSLTGKEKGFYLNDFQVLADELKRLKKFGGKVFLFGVSFALLDFVQQFKFDMPELTIIETGGMKGRAKEMVRNELHAEIKMGFPNSNIHSEYGMTELLSQAYANGNLFKVNPSMHIICRELGDPFAEAKEGKTGILNIVDLANIDTISFIETEDLGRAHGSKFEVLGRVDNSMARGCNLLYI